MMAFMRSAGVRVLGMIDDYLWAERPERIEAVKQAVLQVLPGLGWTLNAKCELEPQDEVLMLGMLINTKEFVVKAPAKKVNASVSGINEMLRKHASGQRIVIQDVQKVTGRLMSMMLAFAGVRVFTRDLYRIIAVATEANEVNRQWNRACNYAVQLSQGALKELEFWSERLATHNGLEINCRETQVQVLLWSDASDVGFGGKVAEVLKCVSMQEVAAALPKLEAAEAAYGSLPRGEIARSSTRRELVGLLLVAQSPRILPKIRGKRIRMIMDSVPALRNLIKGGGPVENLCESVKAWTRFCEKEGIKAVYEWVPRAENWRADELSKLEVQQHKFRKEGMEEEVRQRLNAVSATQWRKRNNHFVFGKVAVFAPMFHQVDARVEMIRSQLEEAIVIVPRWPAGGTRDWYRRIKEHSIAQIALGRVSEWYKERPQTGHDDQLEAFWLMGRRGEVKRNEAAAGVAV